MEQCVVMKGPSQPRVLPHGKAPLTKSGHYQTCHVAQHGHTELAYNPGPWVMKKRAGQQRKQTQRVDAVFLSQAIIDDGSRLEKATLCDREPCDSREC